MRKTNPKYPSYEISDDGRVFRVLCADGRARLGEVYGRVLVSGYRQFKLVNADGDRVLVRANRLIAETFIGEPPSPDHHCAHNDGVRLNNSVGNLRWATAKENCADMDRHGTKPRGCRMQNASLSDAQLAEVRVTFTGKRGEIAALAKRFSTGYSTMNRICHGYSYPALDKRSA